jgi:hypothetical protein
MEISMMRDIRREAIRPGAQKNLSLSSAKDFPDHTQPSDLGFRRHHQGQYQIVNNIQEKDKVDNLREEVRELIMPAITSYNRSKPAKPW